MVAVLDLFAGACGGWSLGMHRAGYETVAACEIDEWRRSVYLQHFPGVRMYADVRDLSATRLRDDLGELPSVVVGSPPCQDASSANHRGLGVLGKRTGLFFEAVRLVREVRPAWCCFENSPRLRTRGVDLVLDELEQAGYTCWPVVVDSRSIGAPHKRTRIWVLCADPNQVREPIEPVNGKVAGMVGPNPWGIGWSEASPSFHGVVDGISDESCRALERAYGDAILPQISEAIGRTMMALVPQ